MKNKGFILFLVCFFIAFNCPFAFSGMAYTIPRGGGGTAMSGGAPIMAGASRQAEYYIAPGDTIGVFVWQSPDLCMEVSIRPDGKMSFPLIGTLKASGLTVEQLENKLKEELSVYIRAPQVSVTVRQYVGNKIVILGEIGYPGIYTYEGTLNLLELVALAGDFTVKAKKESIVVVSGNFTEHPTARRVNIFRVLWKGASTDELFLKPNDVVYVPKSFIGDLNQTINDLQPTASAISTFIGLRNSVRQWYMHKGGQ